MKLTYNCTHSFDGENDVALTIQYEYTPPSPARGPTYDCGGEPAGYAEVEVISMLVDGVPATNEQMCQVDECTRLYEEMELHGAECIADERAAAAEYRAEMRRDDL
ncbi:hypothetical protein UFOVP868_70 [uncultured Caudovirales phage]|uniref:Uncharacterized protein n=1 Tax=uncultured Caudovirales phage TaxID=2100421 RepID=A0A6J5P9S0_9CAUD|nr:hypothetical protein UFOVP868_70 [uncultured Caudovirales phage]